jgi:hypothetical protein
VDEAGAFEVAQRQGERARRRRQGGTELGEPPRLGQLGEHWERPLLQADVLVDSKSGEKLLRARRDPPAHAGEQILRTERVAVAGIPLDETFVLEIRERSPQEFYDPDGNALMLAQQLNRR